jgi:hypothetical protein
MASFPFVKWLAAKTDEGEDGDGDQDDRRGDLDDRGGEADDEVEDDSSGD